MANLHNLCEPQALNEIVGSAETVSVLKHIISQPLEDRPHSYIFTGPPGCGKSMAANVFAKELHVDMIWGYRQYGPADYDRKDCYEQVVRDSLYRGFHSGAYKFIYFDEAQRMPVSVVAKLLIPLNEPEPWCIYVLSIVEIPDTLEWQMVKSRCVPLEMRQLNQPELATLLRNCAKKFGKAVPDSIVDMIWQRVGGVPRDALVRLGMVRNTLPDLDLTVQ